MKNIYLNYARVISLVLALFSFTISMAQPAFTSADIPNIGDNDTTITIANYDLPNDLDAATGNDYTWDFSDLPFSTYSFLFDVDTYREKQHDMAEYFPDATIERYTNGINSEWLGYYQIRNDTLLMYRYSSPSAAGWFPPIALMAFPLEFNESSDITSTFYYGDLATGERRAIVKYDGFGTLKMPDNKTHHNVFRVKSVERDTTFVTNGSITYTSYIWYQQGGKVPLLQIRNMGTPGSYIILGSKANGSQTGLNKLEELHNITLFPNPVQSSLNIDIPNAQDIIETKLINPMGQIIKVFPYLPKTIDVHDLPKGLYYIQLKTKLGIGSRTFIKN